ncbi:MAG: hypothetical protein JSV18_00100 [Candidatus Bathyarchaeota archaeon]|nr:MAG: hypothetical protein JSV18_00100 [Candidatus Bathyarchaeota archaeon]
MRTPMTYAGMAAMMCSSPPINAAMSAKRSHLSFIKMVRRITPMITQPEETETEEKKEKIKIDLPVTSKR